MCGTRGLGSEGSIALEVTLKESRGFMARWCLWFIVTVHQKHRNYLYCNHVTYFIYQKNIHIFKNLCPYILLYSPFCNQFISSSIVSLVMIHKQHFLIHNPLI